MTLDIADINSPYGLIPLFSCNVIAIALCSHGIRTSLKIPTTNWKRVRITAMSLLILSMLAHTYLLIDSSVSIWWLAEKNACGALCNDKTIFYITQLIYNVGIIFGIYLEMVAICLVFKRMAMILPSSKTALGFNALFLIQFLFAFLSSFGIMLMNLNNTTSSLAFMMALLILISLFLLVAEVVSAAVFLKMIRLVCLQDSKLVLSIRASRTSTQARINHALQRKLYFYLAGLIVGDVVGIALQIMASFPEFISLGLTYYSTSWFCAHVVISFRLLNFLYDAALQLQQSRRIVNNAASSNSVEKLTCTIDNSNNVCRKGTSTLPTTQFDLIINGEDAGEGRSSHEQSDGSFSESESDKSFDAFVIDICIDTVAISG